MKLNNKIALVTGGTSGIGLEAARLFQSEGATVIVTGTHAERLAKAAIVLGERARVLSVDLRDPGTATGPTRTQETCRSATSPAHS